MRTGQGWRAMMGVLVAMAPLSSGAAELSRCIGHGGAVSYVSGACPANLRTDWHQDLAPVAPVVLDADARARMADARAWQARNRAEVSSLVRSQNARSRSRSTGTIDRCGAARSKRDRIRDRDFRAMTFDRAVALDDQVREACR